MVSSMMFPEGVPRRGGLLKWIILLVIIIAVLWYLNNQGYVDIPWF